MKTTGLVGIAAGAAVIGLLVGLGLGRSGKAELAERADQQGELMSQVSTLSDKLDGLESRFDSLSEEIQSVGAGVGDQSQQFSALQDKLGEMSSSVTGVVSGLSSDLSGAVSELSNDLGGRMREQISDLSSQLAAFRVEEETDEEVSGQLVRPGETLLLGDGAARVFLSSVSLDSQSARVAIDGTGTQNISVGVPVTAGGCEITLTAIMAPSAMIDSNCDGTGAAAGSSGEATYSEPVGLGEGTELQVGNATSFGDGAARVFLSQFDPSAGSARIAVNGTATTTLAVGDSMDVGECTITLTGMGEKSVSVDASCAQ